MILKKAMVRSVTSLLLAYAFIQPIHAEGQVGLGVPIYDSKDTFVGNYVGIEGLTFERSGFYYSSPLVYQEKNHKMYTTFTYFDSKCEKTPYFLAPFPVANFVLKVTADKIFVTTSEVRKIKEGETIYSEYYDMEDMKLKRRCVGRQQESSWTAFAQKLEERDRKKFTKETSIDFSIELVPPFKIGKK